MKYGIDMVFCNQAVLLDTGKVLWIIPTLWMSPTYEGFVVTVYFFILFSKTIWRSPTYDGFWA